MGNQGFFEESIYSAKCRLIAGVDEVGRGPLAGPVVAAACILPRGLQVEGINDSKKLTPKKRKELFHILTAHPDVHYGIGIFESAAIDEMNILQATLKAMAHAVEALSVKPDYLLVDGNYLPPTHIAAKAVVKGDRLSQVIAAASIIAKCYRDDLMENRFHKEYPQYGFDSHKGYGTKKHLEALKTYGPCPIHRRSFEPVRSLTCGAGSVIKSLQPR